MLLRSGSTGLGVKALQVKLNQLGLGPLVEDGIFGQVTESAVRIFQQSVGILSDGVVGPQTEGAMPLLGPLRQEHAPWWVGQLLLVLEAKGYSAHQDGQCNIIGVRSSESRANQFDDWIYLVWMVDGEWDYRTYPATTDPGIAWLEAPGQASGTAILCPGQYEVYKWDRHAGRYETLCQREGTVRVYRDANQDEVLDMDPESTAEGWFGINIHHAGEDSRSVDKWSAGCQVFKRLADWQEAVRIWKDTRAELFTYTLILEEDLPCV